jgi:hypothetical protein
MDFDMRKLAGGLAQMCIEAGIAAFVLPCRVDLGGGVAEHRAEAVLDAHSVAEFFFDGVDAHLRDVGPDAEDVRKILDLDDAHVCGLATRFRLDASASGGIDLGQATLAPSFRLRRFRVAPE